MGVMCAVRGQVVRKGREGFGRLLRVRSKGVRCLSWAEAPLRICLRMPEAVAMAILRGLD